MNCPKCGAVNPGGAMICSKCDHILDKSFLGEDFTDSNEPQPAPPEKPWNNEPAGGPQAGVSERSRRRRPVAAQAASKPAGPTTEKKASKPPPAKAPPDSQATARKAKRTAQDTPEQGSFAPQQDESLKAEGARVAKDVEGSLKKMWSFFQSLKLADKLAMGGSVGAFVFTFFPWVRIPPVETITGFEIGGWFAALAGLGTGILVYLRQQKEWAEKKRYLLFAQIACAAVAMLFLLVKMGTVRDIKFSGAEMGIVDLQPPAMQPGLLFCFLAAVAMLGGTLMLYKEFTGKK